MREAKVLLATKSTVNQPLNVLCPIEWVSTVNCTAEKSEQLSNRSVQSREKIESKNPHFRNQQGD